MRSVIRLIPLVTLMAASVLAACSEKAKEDSDSAAGQQRQQEEPCTEGCEDDQTFGELGLASHCSFSKDVAGKGCFVCSPRDLPRSVCVEVDELFDPAKACEHDLDLMICRVRTGAVDFQFDFSEETQFEKIYAKIPLFFLGAKVVIGSKLKDKPVIKELLFSSFDSILKHKKAVFTQGDLSLLLDEVGMHLKKAKPSLKDSDIAAAKAAMKAAADKLIEANIDGKMEDGDFLTFAHSVLSAMPSELVGNTLEELDIQEVLSSLASNGNTDAIEDLITNYEGSDIEGAGLRLR